MRLLIAIFFLTGCGYTLNTIPSRAEAPTISVPYVEGDRDGKLTEAIIHEISISGEYVYRTFGGEWILQAKIIDDSYENIGYRYDQSKKCKLKHYLIPVELREGVLLEVQLVSSCNEAVRLGPTRLLAELDFDHDYYTIRDGVNIFSLGQLTDIDSAEDAAKTPLYQKLAEKVVSWLIYSE